MTFDERFNCPNPQCREESVIRVTCTITRGVHAWDADGYYVEDVQVANCPHCKVDPDNVWTTDELKRQIISRYEEGLG